MNFIHRNCIFFQQIFYTSPQLEWEPWGAKTQLSERETLNTVVHKVQRLQAGVVNCDSTNLLKAIGKWVCLDGHIHCRLQQPLSFPTAPQLLAAFSQLKAVSNPELTKHRGLASLRRKRDFPGSHRVRWTLSSEEGYHRLSDLV